jgi:glutamine synthetase
MRLGEKFTHSNGTLTAVRRGKSEFGELVFAGEVLRQYLSDSALEGLRRWEEGEPISLALADEIANGMRQWAEDRGATHYTHWFHPLTGLTAEKHEALYEVIDGKPLYALNGSELLQQEPDASSFPSGGCAARLKRAATRPGTPPPRHSSMATPSVSPPCISPSRGKPWDYKVPPPAFHRSAEPSCPARAEVLLAGRAAGSHQPSGLNRSFS